MITQQKEHHQKLLFAARDAIGCGHIENVPKAAARLDARLQDALGLNAGLGAAIRDAYKLMPDDFEKESWRVKYGIWLDAARVFDQDKSVFPT